MCPPGSQQFTGFCELEPRRPVPGHPGMSSPGSPDAARAVAATSARPGGQEPRCRRSNSSIESSSSACQSSPFGWTPHSAIACQSTSSSGMRRVGIMQLRQRGHGSTGEQLGVDVHVRQRIRIRGRRSVAEVLPADQPRLFLLAQRQPVLVGQRPTLLAVELQCLHDQQSDVRAVRRERRRREPAQAREREPRSGRRSNSAGRP